MKKEAKRLTKKKNQEEHIELSKAEPKVQLSECESSTRYRHFYMQNQLSILRRPNQSKCIVPELQLKPINKIYLCKHPVRHGVLLFLDQRGTTAPP